MGARECMQCGSAMLPLTVRAIVRTDVTGIYGLMVYGLYKCAQCGAVEVPPRQGIKKLKSEDVVACSSELYDLLFAGAN